MAVERPIGWRQAAGVCLDLSSSHHRAMPAGMRIVVVAFLTAITACGGNGPTGGDLAIQGTASAFQVAIPEVVPDTWYQLKVMIINFSTDTTGGDIGDFEVSCEIFLSDDLGVWRKSLMTQSVGNLTVDAFDTTEAVFAPFRQVPGAELSAYFYIDCRADPDAAVAEIDEENNGFTFLFQAYCMGGSNPCPGPIQTGPSLPYIPPNTPAP
jgi:hypothetical protein